MVTTPGSRGIVIAVGCTLPILATLLLAESRSEPLAARLGVLMAEKQLETFALQDHEHPGTYVAVRLYPRVQLLVVSGVPQSPAEAQAALEQRRYGDVYNILHQAVVRDSKFFVQDMHADGLKAHSRDAVDLIYEQVVHQEMFDGEPSKHRLTTAEYEKQFSAADQHYSRLLELLTEGLSSAASMPPRTPAN